MQHTMNRLYDAKTAKRYLDALDSTGSRLWHAAIIKDRSVLSPAAGLSADNLIKWLAGKPQGNVYVRPNPAAGGHADEHTTDIAAVWVDVDAKSYLPQGVQWDSADEDVIAAAMDQAHAASKRAHQGSESEVVEGWPLGSIIVASGRGFHVYWLVHGCPVDRFKEVQHALAARFGSDRSVCNPSRLMRLPGTWNHKDAEPVQAVLRICKPERQYEIDDLLERLGVDLDTHRDTPAEGELVDDPFIGKADTPQQRVELRSALDVLDPDMARADWLKVCASIIAHDWPDAVKIAHEWSARSSLYDEKARRDINGLKAEGGLTPSTVYYMAREAGWRAPVDCPDGASDDGMACRFISWLDNCTMFARGQWLVWSGHHWEPNQNAALLLLKKFAIEYQAEAASDYGTALRNGEDGKNEKRILIAATKLLDTRRQADVMKAASAMLYTDGSTLDADPWLLCVPNGAVDLRTGALLAPTAHATSREWRARLTIRARRVRAFSSSLRKCFLMTPNAITSNAISGTA